MFFLPNFPFRFYIFLLGLPKPTQIYSLNIFFYSCRNYYYYYYYYYYYFLFFFTPALADGFPLQFEWQEIPYITRTLLSILTDLNNAIVWMAYTCPLISKSSWPNTKPLNIVPNAQITIGITFMFHSCFTSPPKSRHFPSFFFIFILLSFSFTLWSVGTTKSSILPVLFFFFYNHLVLSSSRDYYNY